MLNVKNIKLNMTARTKEEVIEELTDLLIQDGAVTNKEDFIRDVWLREELGSTGFENHIAIPHGKSSGVSRTALAIGRTQHAIPWETMDGSDVRCVILFAVCLVDQNATHTYPGHRVVGAGTVGGADPSSGRAYRADIGDERRRANPAGFTGKTIKCFCPIFSLYFSWGMVVA